MLQNEEGNTMYTDMSLEERCALLEKLCEAKEVDGLARIFIAKIAEEILLTKSEKELLPLHVLSVLDSLIKV